MLIQVDYYRWLNTDNGSILTSSTMTQQGGSPPADVLSPQLATPYQYAAAVQPSNPAALALIGPTVPSGNLQRLEAQIPGIGNALVKLTQGWDHLNWIERGLILAAVALVGVEALGALGIELGIGGVLGAAIKLIPGAAGLANLFKGGGAAGPRDAVPPGFLPSWVANGVQFYKNTTTGQLGVLNGKGKWKHWKPRRPVGVVYSNGVSNLKCLASVTKAVRKQLGNINKSINAAEASGPRKRIAAPKKYTPQEMREIAAAVK